MSFRSALRSASALARTSATSDNRPATVARSWSSSPAGNGPAAWSSKATVEALKSEAVATGRDEPAEPSAIPVECAFRCAARMTFSRAASSTLAVLSTAEAGACENQVAGAYQRAPVPDAQPLISSRDDASSSLGLKFGNTHPRRGKIVLQRTNDERLDAGVDVCVCLFNGERRFLIHALARASNRSEGCYQRPNVIVLGDGVPRLNRIPPCVALRNPASLRVAGHDAMHQPMPNLRR